MGKEVLYGMHERGPLQTAVSFPKRTFLFFFSLSFLRGPMNEREVIVCSTCWLREWAHDRNNQNSLFQPALKWSLLQHLLKRTGFFHWVIFSSLFTD